MPNQTLYDNFSQVRQYIDQEKPDLSSYVTKTELSNCGYITSSDLPVIDESIVPKENNTYTLGDSSYIYNATYSTKFYTRVSNLTGFENNNNYTGILIRVGGNQKLDINNNDIRPVSNDNYNLGTANAKFGSTYTSNLYLNSNIALTSDGSGLFVTTAGNIKFSFDVDSFHPYGSTYSGLLDLGTSTRTWRSTYTKYLYLNENKVYIYSNGTGQMKFGVNGADRFRINYNTFEPSISGITNLGGGTSNPFTNAYFTNLYLNGTNIEDRFTYLVWTGTSAEYAALSDYTTYQFYLIKNE